MQSNITHCQCQLSLKTHLSSSDEAPDGLGVPVNFPAHEGQTVSFPEPRSLSGRDELLDGLHLRLDLLPSLRLELADEEEDDRSDQDDDESDDDVDAVVRQAQDDQLLFEKLPHAGDHLVDARVDLHL